MKNLLYAIIFIPVLLIPNKYEIRPQNAPVSVSKAETANVATPHAKAPQKSKPGQETIIPPTSKTEIYDYVVKEAKIYGVDPIKATWIVSKESQWDPTKMGDDGNSRGLFQISRIWHPEVSDACAMDWKCSTRWSLDFMAKNPNNMNQWSTYRLCKKLYGECPE